MKRGPKIEIVLLLIATGSLGLGVAAVTAESRDVEQTGFVDTVDVNVVNVPVFVTDKKGAWVTGLTRHDFRIFEDGKRVKITHFFATAGPWAATEPDRPGILPSGTEVAPEEDAVHIVIYVDSVQTSPASRAAALQLLRNSILAGLHEPHRAMLIEYTHGLEIVQPFTGDPLLMASVLERLQSEDTSDVAVAVRSEEFLGNLDRLVEQAERFGEQKTLADTLPHTIQSHVEFLDRKTLESLEHLRYVVGAMGHLSGRRVLLYVSDGLGTAHQTVLREALTRIPGLVSYRGSSGETRRREDITGGSKRYVDDEPGTVVTPEISEYDEIFDVRTTRRPRSRDLTQVTDLASAVGVTIYLANTGTLTASTRGSDPSDKTAETRIGSFDRIRDTKFHSPGTLLAEATGGTVFGTFEELDDWLSSVLDDSRAYYLLGYRPRRGADGKSHTIKVKTTSGGWRLRYRTGYVAQPRRTQEIQRVLSALLLGYEHNPLEIQLQFGQQGPRTEEGLAQPVRVLIPVGQLALEQRGQQFQTSIDLFVATMGPAGALALPIDETVAVRIPADRIDAAPRVYFPVDFTVVAQPGSNTLAVGVRDTRSGAASFASRTFHVGHPESAR